jgi:hypothetical protein
LKVISTDLKLADFSLEFPSGEPPNWLLALFADDEYEILMPSDEEKKDRKWPRHHWHELSIHGMASTASAICERLDLAGFTSEKVSAVLKSFTDYQISHGIIPEALANYRDHAAWAIAFSTALADPELQNAGLLDMKADSLVFLMAVWHDLNRAVWEGADDRLMLRAIAEAFDPKERVALELTMVESSEGHDRPRNRSTALEFLGADFSVQAPAVIFTEGSTDASILKLALEVMYPHLVDYIRFLDYDRRNKPETSAGALKRTINAFSAAGLGNRLIAIFDNDAVATDIVESIDVDDLAPNIRVLQYPPIEIARRYPVFETGSSAEYADVNGLACSIELYLGHDVLASSGELAPVRWCNYIGKARRRQGEIVGKRELQRRFQRKALRTLKNPESIEWEMWADLKQILDSIRSAFVLRSSPFCVVGNTHDGTMDVVINDDIDLIRQRRRSRRPTKSATALNPI